MLESWCLREVLESQDYDMKDMKPKSGLKQSSFLTVQCYFLTLHLSCIINSVKMNSLRAELNLLGTIAMFYLFVCLIVC